VLDPLFAVGVVGTYPPTTCGIATFTASLVNALRRSGPPGRRLEVVSLVDERDARPRGVSLLHLRGHRASLRATGALLDGCGVVSLQHEYGIFAGRDGHEVLDLLDSTSTPAVVTLHTVVRTPTRSQRDVLVHLADRASRVVVMSRVAAERLVRIYGIGPERIVVIPHGVDPRLQRPARPPERPTILTWGLLGPGKGIEIVLEALAWLRDVRPQPEYLVLGATHPGVRAREGERYREGLEAQVRSLGLDEQVRFVDRYLTDDELTLAIRSASIVALPYDAVEQVTSGVLVEAVAAGRPVVATAFPHAQEVLPGGAGLVVPHRDPAAFAGALRALLTDPALAARCAREARRQAASWAWPAVAGQYDAVFRAEAQRHARGLSVRAEVG
jgi:glycosyltransferase involved in cell wall biosynthesis